MDLDAAAPPVLQFDLGNTRAKWRLAQGARVLARGAGPTILECVPDWRALQGVPAAVQVASVGSEAAEDLLADTVHQCFALPPWFARSSAAAGRLRSAYVEPASLGVDRWLAMLAVSERCRERSCVVDAGSALTIDLLSLEGAHEGGYILPGAALMERALLLDTQRVRFAPAAATTLDPARCTADCVHNGIALAQAGAVRLALERAGSPVPRLFLCGGGAQRLQALLAPLPLQWAPDLVFEGLSLLARLESAD